MQCPSFGDFRLDLRHRSNTEFSETGFYFGKDNYALFTITNHVNVYYLLYFMKTILGSLSTESVIVYLYDI